MTIMITTPHQRDQTAKTPPASTKRRPAQRKAATTPNVEPSANGPAATDETR